MPKSIHSVFSLLPDKFNINTTIKDQNTKFQLKTKIILWSPSVNWADNTNCYILNWIKIAEYLIPIFKTRAKQNKQILDFRFDYVQ